MKNKLIIFGLIVVIGCMLPSVSFAQDYAQVNIFNRFTDWTVTLGKSPDEKQRIINERIQSRAHHRETRDYRKNHEQPTPSHQDQANRNTQGGDRDHQVETNGPDNQQRHF